MFFLLPVLTNLPQLVYLAAAILPAAFLLRYVYRHDTIEKEPARLLAALLVMGCLSAVLAGILEAFGEAMLRVWVAPTSPVYTVLLAFVVVAAVEEGAKFVLLKLRSWNHPAFNYRFDGIVYAVFVSLGFAALENVQYVVSYGLSVALPRAVLSIPGHLSFSIFMGVYYGRAKLREMRGDASGARTCLFLGWLVATLLHGFYDACAMLDTAFSMIVFGVFVIVMFFFAYRTLKRESATDEPLDPQSPYDFF